MDIVTEQPVDTAALMQRVIAQNPNSYHFHLPLAPADVRGDLWLTPSGCYLPRDRR
jgi:isochorismate synthase EntC